LPDPGVLSVRSRVSPGSPPHRRRHIPPPMPPRTPFARSPVALLANAGTWLNQALESMLEPLGYRVLSVATGRELLDRAPTTRPDVILMDANLQDLDSITVSRPLRQHRAVSSHTPIFI